MSRDDEETEGLRYSQKRQLYLNFCEVFNGLDADKCYRRYQDFLLNRGEATAGIEKLFDPYEPYLFDYLELPASYRHWLRTVNLTEGFFHHLRKFLRRFPGRASLERINEVMGVFLFGLKTYKEHYGLGNPCRLLPKVS